MKFLRRLWRASDVSPTGNSKLYRLTLVGLVFYEIYMGYAISSTLPTWWRVVDLVLFGFTSFTFGWTAFFLWNKLLRVKVMSQPIDDLGFLTQAEITHINSHQTCPDCAIGSLLEGPRGGCSMNTKCDNPDCRHEFNLAWHFGKILVGNRIDRDEPSLYKTPL